MKTLRETSISQITIRISLELTMMVSWLLKALLEKNPGEEYATRYESAEGYVEVIPAQVDSAEVNYEEGGDAGEEYVGDYGDEYTGGEYAEDYGDNGYDDKDGYGDGGYGEGG